MLTVLPTIDVEGVHGRRPFDEYILGRFGDGEEWGVYRQAEIFSRFGISATFFVDVYEYTMWGEEPLRQLCQRLVDLGQDVQLHTHPGWRDDPRDPEWLRAIRREKSYLGPRLDLMAKLPYRQQVEVLSHGIELLERWIGRRPVAHRSGGYSINEDTIQALREVGIALDSSMNSAHSNSRVTWSKNAAVASDGLTEIPVTVCECVVGAFGIPLRTKLVKADVESLIPAEFGMLAGSAIGGGLSTLTMFMHSYSFVDRSRGLGEARPNPAMARRLEDTLEVLSGNASVQFMNFAQLDTMLAQEPDRMKGTDMVPRIRIAPGRVAAMATRRIGDAIFR